MLVALSYLMPNIAIPRSTVRVLLARVSYLCCYTLRLYKADVRRKEESRQKFNSDAYWTVSYDT